MPVDLPAPPPVPQERARGEWRGIVLRLTVALVVLVGGYVALAYYLGGRVPAGTTVEGVDVGTLSEDGARSVLQDKLDDTATEPVLVQLDQEQAAVEPAGAGLSLDLEQTLSGLAGLSFDPRDLWARLSGDGRSLSLATEVDRGALDQSVEAAAEEIDRDPVQATVGFREGQVETTLPEEGIALEVDETADLIEEQWPTSTTISAPSVAVPSDLTREQVETFVGEYAEPAVAKPVVVEVEDEKAEASLSPNQLSRLLRVEQVDNPDGDPSLSLRLDQEGVADVVDGALVEVEQAPRNASVRLGDQGRPEVVDAVVGKEIDEQAVLAGVREILRAETSASDADEGGGTDEASRTGTTDSGSVDVDGRTVTVSATEVQPEIGDDEAADWKVDAVMGEFTSEFPTGPSNEARTENIRVGLRYVNGSVVMPDEQFSLADTLAPISRDRGYVEAGVIANGRLVEGIGGGLSQVSTTVLNTAWFSGVELNEFTPHSYYISRYPVGREATISVGAIDNVWTNDTDTPMVIQTFIDGDDIVMRFYGDRQYTVETRTGERRKSTQPETRTDDSADCLTQGAVEGFTITVARDLIQSGDVVRTDEYTTTYEPSPGVTCTNSSGR